MGETWTDSGQNQRQHMSFNEVSHRVRFGPYEADLRTQELWKHGTRLKLSGQPFKILEVLLSRPGILITREELRKQLWPEDTFVDFSHGLNAAVNKLRDALCDSADNPKYIETLPRRGYRFIGQVESTGPLNQEGPIAADAVESMPADTAEDQAQPVPLREEPNRWKFRIWTPIVLAIAVPVLLIVLVRGNRDFFAGRSIMMHASVPAAIEPVVNVSDAVSDPALSPDGNRLAFVRKGSTPATTGIFVKNTSSDQTTQLTRTPADCCPRWSPDGKSIAFWRNAEEASAIYSIPASGGQEQQLVLTGSGGNSRWFDWAPDGNSLALYGTAPDRTDGLYLVSLYTHTWKRLTETPSIARDWAPAFSPDGRSLAFIRSQPDGFPDGLMLLSLADGSVRQLTDEHNSILGPPAWDSDGKSIVYASTRQATPQLWRYTLATGNSSTIADAGDGVAHPSISLRGFRLAFEQIRRGSSIEQLEFAKSTSESRSVVTSTSGRNEGPQLSPDGKRMVFMSDRSGSMEIWVAAADGSNPIQLTALGTAGTPRWSPDGKLIAFDSRPDGRGAIYLVPSSGGDARVLVKGDAENSVPSFSRDGQWVYFASDREGGWNIWKIPVTGGTAVAVTSTGGFAAEEAADGYIYFASTPYPNPEIWRIPVAGGKEERVNPRLVPRIWATWAIAPKGIYFVQDGPNADCDLEYYDFATQALRHVATLTRAPFWLAASPNGDAVLVDQADQEQRRIMMVRNFR